MEQIKVQRHLCLHLPGSSQWFWAWLAWRMWRCLLRRRWRALHPSSPSSCPGWSSGSTQVQDTLTVMGFRIPGRWMPQESKWEEWNPSSLSGSLPEVIATGQMKSTNTLNKVAYFLGLNIVKNVWDNVRTCELFLHILIWKCHKLHL